MFSFLTGWNACNISIVLEKQTNISFNDNNQSKRIISKSIFKKRISVIYRNSHNKLRIITDKLRTLRKFVSKKIKLLLISF